MRRSSYNARRSALARSVGVRSITGTRRNGGGGLPTSTLGTGNAKGILINSNTRSTDSMISCHGNGRHVGGTIGTARRPPGRTARDNGDGLGTKPSLFRDIILLGFVFFCGVNALTSTRVPSSDPTNFSNAAVISIALDRTLCR